MNECDEIKNMFWKEGLTVPNNLQESLDNIPVYYDENMKEVFAWTTRQKFLVIATNRLLVQGFKDIIMVDGSDKEGLFGLHQLNKPLHDKYIKLSNELKELEK